ncbi:MAG TPA: tyrosine-protein phosphatase [Polyangiaceae bacterium]|nr:tyrosine-protein phosphatase [Polyangiaceae bacterium]
MVNGTAASRHVIYRGGQPTAAGWAYLRGVLGVTTVVKLNAPEESWSQGWDEPAEQLGMRVVRVSIPPHDYGLAPASLPEPFRDVPEDKVALAITRLADDEHGNVYVHCTHGRDRTGLIVGLYRVFEQHWDPRTAYAEMNQTGFRPLNRNLHEFWENLFEHAENADASAKRARLADAITKQQGKP